MKYEHLKAALATLTEASRFEDSQDFEAYHGKIAKLLKQLDLMLNSNSYADWIKSSDENFDYNEPVSDLYSDIKDNVTEAKRLHDKLYQVMLDEPT